MSKPYATVRRDVSKKDPTALADLLAQYNRELTPSFRQLRSAFATLATDIDNGAFTLGTIVVREVTGVPTNSDANGSVAFSDLGIYTRRSGAWVLLGVISSVTAGAGLVDHGAAGAPVIDAVALDKTLTVLADGMKVGTVTSSNVDDSIVTDARLTLLARSMREDAAQIRMLLLQQIKLELGMELDSVDGL